MPIWGIEKGIPSVAQAWCVEAWNVVKNRWDVQNKWKSIVIATGFFANVSSLMPS